MNVTRTSQLTGIKRTLDLDVTPEQLSEWDKNGLSMDEATESLSRRDLIFLRNGTIWSEWEALEKWERHDGDGY